MEQVALNSDFFVSVSNFVISVNHISSVIIIPSWATKTNVCQPEKINCKWIAFVIKGSIYDIDNCDTCEKCIFKVVA